MVQGERHHERSHCEESPHDESHPERSHHESSLHKGSHHERTHRERPHWERPRRERSHHGESRNNCHDDNDVNAEVKDLKRKYADMAHQIAGDEVKSTARELLEDTYLPFSNRVMAFSMPDKFKMPHVDKYNGSGDLTEHVENFRAHLILHGTPNKIACRAFPLTLAGVAKD
jgi:hypothetical protein